MLILSRKQHQEIVIGEQIIIRVCQLKSSTVRIGVEAPQEVSIRRAELDNFAPEFVLDITRPLEPDPQTKLAAK